LRGIRATFPWLSGYTLSGVWRLLRRHKLHIRSALLRQHSPDPQIRSGKVEGVADERLYITHQSVHLFYRHP
jgi:hypothetical protein